jgi:hypothetical protein
MSLAEHVCPRRDLGVLDKSATLVLVPGHPTGLLACRYASFDDLGIPGAFGGAVSATRGQAIAHLASEFDALGPLKRGLSCPVFGGRSELFMFSYKDARTVRVRLIMHGCIPVTNGRVVREGLGLHFAGGEVHWPDESLL